MKKRLGTITLAAQCFGGGQPKIPSTDELFFFSNRRPSHREIDAGRVVVDGRPFLAVFDGCRHLAVFDGCRPLASAPYRLPATGMR
ncbi:hypothetical protein E2562_010846 [Oryza meyeriana var. granulata]|uniref:Uncharacterized protein n=1 Tax=Oryza meyeriana var. granulata TaxID=110450 RepID=A0A6G1BL54_9ORYZ|nr:hypothetical protein E2562_010846 [Oryza meyeriana var. granulata]